MSYREIIFGPTAKLKLLAVDEQQKLIAVATTNGLIKIYSETIESIYNVDIGMVSDLQFVNGKGCLVALTDERSIHFIVGEAIHDPYVYHFTTVKFDVGSLFSIIQICQIMIQSVMSFDTFPLLTVNVDSGIELVLINQTKLIRTTKIATRLFDDNHLNHIIRIAETDYDDGKVTVLVLWNDLIQLVRFTCSWTNEEHLSDPTLASFELDYIICSCVNDKEVSNISVTSPHCFIVATLNGEYGRLRYDSNRHTLILEDTVFPYGPFPCKSINKCVQLPKSRNERNSYIFCGGLPEVTYNSLHTISIAIEDEPDICFTFYDPIITFELIRHTISSKDSKNSEIVEIVVLTESQAVTIINNGGHWKSTTICHFSPISRNEVMAISNIIEIDTSDCVNNLTNPCGHLEEQKFTTRLLSTYHDDTMLTLWKINDDKITKFTEILVESFFRNDNCQIPDKIILWPKFQKCGLWINRHSSKKVNINTLKLVSNNGDTIDMLCSIENQIIFHFKILLKIDYVNSQTVNTLSYQKHVYINVTEDDLDVDRTVHIVESVSGLPVNVELQSIIILSENVILSELYLEDFMIIFGGSDGIGLVDTLTLKSFFISSEELSLVDSSQSKSILSELILKRLRKRKSFESSNLRKNNNKKLKKTALKSKIINIECFTVFVGKDNTYDLLIGFDTGLVMILSLSIDEKGDLVVSSNYRKLESRTKDPVVAIRLLSCSADDLEMSLKTNGKEPYFDESKMNRGSIDSTKANSLSTGSQSTNRSNDSYQVTTELSSTKSLTRKLSLKWTAMTKKGRHSELMLMRCDRNSVKLIDYIKLKTRFKYKFKEQIRKSEDLSEKIQKLKIIQAKVVKGNQASNSSIVLLCDGGLLFKLSVPILEEISRNEICVNITDLGLLSISNDIILISRNIHINGEIISEIVMLEERRRKLANKSVTRSLKWSNNQEVELTIAKGETDQDGIDFMRCAEPSINSLLW